MFAIIISEKGGAERRESYDRTEISVGRVQGNDLMLPKGNVSKRHARLLYRDGRFIVTDLKSTNGTYVNGRKIAQATIVREGDKIYIGDFVLRIEPAPGIANAAGAAMDESGPSHDGAQRDSQHSQPGSADRRGSIPDRELGAPPPPAPPGLEPPRPPMATEVPRVDSQRADTRMPGQDVISHFPLEHDPDEGAPQPYAVPGPPRIPSGARPPGPPSKPSGPPPSAASGRITSPSMGVAAPLPVSQPLSPVPASAAPSPVPRRSPPSDRAERGAAESAAAAAHRAALRALVGRVEKAVDTAALADGRSAPEDLVVRLERALAEASTALKVEGELPAEIDPDALVVEGRRELLELGPIGPMLADEDVSEVQIFRHDFVVAMHGRRQVPTEVAFTSEAALMRALRRLCLGAGKALGEDETHVERRLEGARLFAVLPPAAAQGHMVLIRKPQRADMTLDDLVRSGTISRAMVGLLSQCVAARANILVTGSLGAGTTSLLGALAAAGSIDDRVVVLQEDDELIFNQPHTISILLGETPPERARAVRAATRVHPDRLVVGSFAGEVAAEVVDAIGDGVDGVLAAARAPTLRQAAARVTADLAASRPGLTPETAREWLSSAFDLCIEIARLRDGRHRVLRVAELGVEGSAVVIRDIFSFSVERTAAGGAVEGSFSATGVTPRIVEDLQARGVNVDTSIFKMRGESR
jgi:pilus assembly protein CpaF